MEDTFQRFDMLAFPKRQRLRLLAWLISFPAVWQHKAEIKKIRMDELKPPYLLLCNHNAFQDFKLQLQPSFRIARIMSSRSTVLPRRPKKALKAANGF